MFSDALLSPLAPLRAYVSLYALLTSVMMVSWAQLISPKATICAYTHLPLPRGAGGHGQLGHLVIYHDFPSVSKVCGLTLQCSLQFMLLLGNQESFMIVFQDKLY